jgi:cytochrome c biogenesis protein CcmG/thiol:disulfide interchange protein DsbE
MTKRNYYNHSLFKSIIIVALSGIIFLSCGKKEEKKPTTEKVSQQIKKETNTNANMAPDFTLTSVEGKDVQLSDYLGKVVIIDFWATWCPPCKAEIPGFVELYDQYADAGLEIIGISLDRGDPSVVSNFVKSYHVNYPIVFYKDEVIMNYGGIQSIPTTFVVDREGKIIERLVGYKPKDFFEKLIKSIL